MSAECIFSSLDLLAKSWR